MIDYTIESVTEDGLATVRFADGSWAEVLLAASMTEKDVDELVWEFRPKTGSVPSFINVGDTRSAIPVVTPANETELSPDWLNNRREAYGNIESQIEFITENGLEAWQAEVAQIKAANPKV